MGNLRMPSMANIVISGRMTADPNHSYTPSGTARAQFRIANDQRRGNAKETLFLMLRMGQDGGLMAEHTRKGSPVLIAGTLEAHSWTKQDGTRAEELEVNVNTIQLLEWDDDKPSGATDRPAPLVAHVNEEPIPEDDIPF